MTMPLKRMLFGSVHILMKLAADARGMGEMTSKGYENADAGHAYEHWFQGNKSIAPFMFLDVRTPGEYAEAHIASAILIPVQALASRLQEVPKNKRVYVYCHSGYRSAKASALLAMAGYTDVVNVLGGIEAWQDAGYPVER